MAGKRQKHPDSLAFKRGGRYRAPLVLAQPGGPAPACPPGILTEEAELAWNELWNSPVSALIKESDHPALHRWVWWLDQWVRTSMEISLRGAGLRGHRGDRHLRGKVRYLTACEAAINRLEEAFGMTPLARMRLGLSFVEGRSSVERLRRVTAMSDPGPDPRRLMFEEANRTSATPAQSTADVRSSGDG